MFWIIFILVPNRPPSIYLQAPYDVYYKVSETVQMQCEADAVPNPKYVLNVNLLLFLTQWFS
jgi:hypothetical protein